MLSQAARRRCCVPVRALCSGTLEAEIRVKNSLILFGLQAGASQRSIKLRYYELAKQTHPDALNGARAREAAAPSRPSAVVRDASTGLLDGERPADAPPVDFLELHAAFEALMDDLDGGSAGGGFGGSGVKKPARWKSAARTKTLGEVLCERLADEPEAVEEVWGDLVGRELRVSGQMLNELLNACAALGPPGLRLSLNILDEGTRSQLLMLGVRSSGLASLLNGAEANGWDVDAIIETIDDEDRESPEVLAALGAVFCAGTRSLY